MSQTQKTGLIVRVTEAALQGKQPTAADFVELAKLLDANSASTSKAITEFHSRISELESQVEALNKQLAAKTSASEPTQAEEQKTPVNDSDEAADGQLPRCDYLADSVTSLLIASLFQREIRPFMGAPTLMLIKP